MHLKQWHGTAVIGLLFVGGIIAYAALRPSFVSRVAPPIPEYTKSWPEYRSTAGGFSIKFPPFVTATAKENEVVFTRSIPLTYTDPCDFVGNNAPRTTLDDVDIGVRVFTSGLKQAIDSVMGREGAWKDFLNEEGAFVTTDFMSEPFRAGRYDGQKLSLSVEWCGRAYYFFENGRTRVIVAAKPIRPDLMEDNELYEDRKKYVTPRPYSLDESDRILKDMIATFEWKN